jgi:hypothetical protein
MVLSTRVSAWAASVAMAAWSNGVYARHLSFCSVSRSEPLNWLPPDLVTT